MREIKFRVWDGDIMRAGADLLIESTDGTIWKNIDIGNGYDKLEELYQSILMQYAGLKDKNGKEIYEGDIIKLQGSNGIGREIIFMQDISAFCYSTKDRTVYRMLSPFLSPHMKVIGNIYENPELLNS